jgi:hypothetical protein
MNGSDFVANPDLETIFQTNDAVYAKAAEAAIKLSGRKSF